MPSGTSVKAGKAFIVVEALDKTGFVLKRVGARLTRFAGQIQGMGQRILTRAIAALIPVGFATRTFASFDDSMRKVEARSKGTAAEMAKLRDQAKLLGRTTSFTASQVGDLQAELARKGFARSEILEQTPHILNLARAAGEGTAEDTALAATVAGAALRQFGMEATETQRVADVFSAAVNNSSLSLQTLSEGMKYAGPVARQFGLSFEDTVTLLGQLGNVGIEGTMAGTALRNMFLKLSNAAGREQFNKSLQQLTGRTIDFVDASGNLRNLPDLIFEIGEATRDLGSTERAGLLEALMGIRPLTPALALGAGRSPFENLNKQIKESEGTAAETARKMDAGLGGTFRRIWSAAEGVAIAIGEALGISLQDLEKTITGCLDSMVKWISTNKQTVVAIVGVIAAAAALGAGMIGLALGIKLVAFAFTGVAVAITVFKTVLALLLSPIGLVAAAIAGVVYLLYRFSASFRNLVGNIAGFVSERFSAIAGTIKDTFGGITKAITQGDWQAAWEIAVEGLYTVWQQTVDAVYDVWESVTMAIVEAWNGAMGTILNVWYSTQKKLAKGILDLAAEKGVLGEVMDLILGVDYSEVRERAKRLGLDPDQAKKDVEAHYDQKIEKGWEAAGAATGAYREKIRKANEEREKGIAESKARLQAALDALDEKAQQVEEAFTITLTPEQEEFLAAVTPAALAPAVGPRVNQALEKGTVEAAQAFYEAMGRDLMTDQLEVQRGILDNTGRTADMLEGMEWEGV